MVYYKYATAKLKRALPQMEEQKVAESVAKGESEGDFSDFVMVEKDNIPTDTAPYAQGGQGGAKRQACTMICTTHKNDVCDNCWDKVASNRLSQRGHAPKVYCTQCGNHINEIELEKRLSSKYLLEYIGAKYEMAVARIRGQDVTWEYADRDGDGESTGKFVLVKKSDVWTEGACNGEAGNKWNAGQACAIM
ncbi:hypothetical protein CKM354_000909000 [Cercospora kikuchii]|uniref:Uncharacterized protein n=1 Tax=Cercospora kikuchii TaxID=84275 RepID=A0A9P3FJT5_9PEZI|nr:uncharacterized protein CKM354_000909000 [Cercospora kikuchii]GIZ45944.1 hypothetical protein CKM354_000909000 [Cercospora kikuchii]